MPKTTRENNKINPKQVITNFFQVAETNERSSTAEVNQSNTKQTDPKPTADFYANYLLENIEDEKCTGFRCDADKNELKRKIEKTKQEIEQILKAQKFAAEIIKEKDNKIKLLQEQIEKHNAAKNQSDSQIATNIAAMNKPPFEDFVQWFTEEQMESIRKVQNSFSEDSTFVLRVTRSLYAENLNDVRNITVKGQGKDSSKKKIDGEKLKIMTEMFSERIDGIADIEEASKDDRKHRLNTLLNRAITNISNSRKRQIDIDLEAQPQLKK